MIRSTEHILSGHISKWRETGPRQILLAWRVAVLRVHLVESTLFTSPPSDFVGPNRATGQLLGCPVANPVLKNPEPKARLTPPEPSDLNSRTHGEYVRQRVGVQINRENYVTSSNIILK